uniref:Uncharacterized protein n=1 Tax=Triticum urartu TaxID=4572 RepID=A0A8R7THU1_TRIUA
MPRHESGLLRVSPFLFLGGVRGKRWEKRPISQMPTNSVPNSPVRTQANVVLVSTPQEDLDDVSVTNSEVESVMNRHRLKEAMRAPALSEQ